MDLSVIILTLNNQSLLQECIASIKNFTKDISYEVIVSDNGSTDGTCDMLRSKHPDIVLIENRKNLGFTVANNKGLKIAKGRYAVLLNDDTFIKENTFQNIVQFMDKDHGIGICGPKLLNIDGTIQRQGSIFTTLKWRSKKPVEVDFVIGACMFIRRSILDKIGLLDENLFFYNDDLDICKRARKAGFRVMYYPDPAVYHYGGYSSKRTFDAKFLVEGFRSGLYFCKKHYGPVIYQIYRALLMVFMPLIALFTLANNEKRDAYMEIFKIALHQQIVHSS